MLSELSAFLVAAKRSTYASASDDASVTPALTGSRQLEYRAGRFLYRDVHFGTTRFAGQETVALDGRVIWSMVYGGGIAPDVTDAAMIAIIQSCLRQALYIVEPARPFRGPRTLGSGALHYSDDSEGDLASFRGTERVTRNGAVVYRLEYCGGLIR
ncbi:DUF5680 domain-containing protein [Dongia deserti]|uniref:DUF5680 domain-containing protein n=1 Tax=Dongia deserti TaxID=2268030 RepID=UPI000E655A3C|nr:DUF5680 domain-containing protein [Dongia deserti]